MLKTFNCGVGFCLIINKKNLKKVQSYFPKDYKPYIIGKIINGKNLKEGLKNENDLIEQHPS